MPSKTAVNDFLDAVKGQIDYNITDDDLDTLLLGFMTKTYRLIKQKLFDSGIYKEIGTTATLSTVADQEYIDVSTTPVDLDEMIYCSERTNDLPIDIISFSLYRDLYTDPSNYKATSPHHAALFDGKLFLGPTPDTSAISIYMDYIIEVSAAAAGGDLPFPKKYDPLIEEGVNWLFTRWKHTDEPNALAVQSAKKDFNDMIHSLITGASSNVNMNRQTLSRRHTTGFGPGIATINTGYGYGVGGYGVGGYGGISA